MLHLSLLKAWLPMMATAVYEWETSLTEVKRSAIAASGPLRRWHAISTILRIFFKQNTTSIHQFIMSNLVNLQSFIVIRCKLVEIWDPELGHFYIFPYVCNGC